MSKKQAFFRTHLFLLKVSDLFPRNSLTQREYVLNQRSKYALEDNCRITMMMVLVIRVCYNFLFTSLNCRGRNKLCLRHILCICL